MKHFINTARVSAIHLFEFLQKTCDETFLIDKALWAGKNSQKSDFFLIKWNVILFS